MAVTWTDLRDFIKANDSQQSALERALAMAEAHLAQLVVIAETRNTPIPDVLLDGVTLEVAQAIFKRNQTPSGQFATPEGVVNVPRDPLAFSMPILRKYIGWL